uniref:POP4 domain-containing protein n=1 Tax=Bursaphelenchus xylophilus TaxID=6326 RepID=A0A1I7RWZ4_BURXY
MENPSTSEYRGGEFNVHLDRTARKKRGKPKNDLLNVIRRQGGGRKAFKDLKYDELKPMYELWCGYFKSVLEEVREDLDQRLLKLDFHGSILMVSTADNPSMIGLNGIVVYESKKTFQLITRKNKLIDTAVYGAKRTDKGSTPSATLRFSLNFAHTSGMDYVSIPESFSSRFASAAEILNDLCRRESMLSAEIGAIKALNDRNHLEKAYCLETRPYLQGSRLTAFELSAQHIPHTLISDNMAAYLMKTRPIHAILVGADQIAANGDTANKIGTYQLAVTAKYHKVPFYVVAPTSSINLRIGSGADIKVEERPADELKIINGKHIAPLDTPVWNPAFDVTPNELISAILTEKGNVLPRDVPTLF